MTEKNRTPNSFVCHIGKENGEIFWQAENFPSVLVGYPFKRVCNAVASCNKFMEDHGFEWEWEK